MISSLFPGQGSQSIGMGNLFYQNFKESKNVFDEVDDALGEKLSSLIFEGNIKDLTRTSNAQPALMAVSMAIVKVIEKETGEKLSNITPIMAGHSLGEYTAACALGVMGISDTAKLLRLRGDEMQKSAPEGVGSMAAVIGLPISVIEKICSEISLSEKKYCGIANDNSPDQVVITGYKESVELAIDNCNEAGAKRVVKLPVSAPFHSPLMKNAADKVEERLSQIVVSEPSGILMSNYTAKASKNANDIKSLLVKQITGRVRFRELVHSIYNENVRKFIEIGPGRVLSTLVKRTESDVLTLCINQPSDIEKAIKFIKE